MTEYTARQPLYRHRKPHMEWARRLRHARTQQRFSRSFALSVGLVLLGFAINLLAVQYATKSVSNPVTDLILSNIPVFDVDGFFVYGTLCLTLFITFLLLAHPKRIPFSLNALGLFWIIRACFTSLTHIAPYPVQIASDFGTFLTHFLLTGGDLFFSGHTGVPFLFALIFWREPGLRNLFLLWSGYFAVVVLLGHLHYSIDVAAAFFITYSIYEMARRLFSRSYAIFCTDTSISGTP